jgi:hypothetical protein
MGGTEDDPPDHQGGDDANAGPPLTPDLLADLQAGLFDDDEAAELRQRIRADPAARRILAALNHVRSDVAALRTDTASVPEVPPAAVDKVRAALRSATSRTGGPRAAAAHSVRPGLPPVRVAAAIAGVAAGIAAIALGTVALIRARAPAPSAPLTAQHITVSSHPTEIPLSAAQILALLDRTPDYGALGEVARRSACLTGLGYPASARVLGAQPIEINGLSAVLLVLPGDTPDALAVLAVSPNCSSADTGLLTDTVVRRP